MSILVQDVFAGLISTTIAQQGREIQAKALVVNEAERIYPQDWGAPLMRQCVMYSLFASDFALRNGFIEGPERV